MGTERLDLRSGTEKPADLQGVIGHADDTTQGGARSVESLVSSSDGRGALTRAGDRLFLNAENAFQDGVAVGGVLHVSELRGPESHDQYLLLGASDLQLNYPPRRDPTSTWPHRRALVHGQEDALVLNCEGDYPAGTYVYGRLRVEELQGGGKGNWLNISAHDVWLDHPARRRPDEPPGHSTIRRALVHDVGDKLVLNYQEDYLGGVEIHGEVRLSRLGGDSSDIATVIQGLQETVSTLQRDVTALRDELRRLRGEG